MKVYSLNMNADFFHSLKPLEPAGYRWLTDYKGQSKIEHPDTLRFALYKRKTLGDFCYIAGHIPIISEKAMVTLRPILVKRAEFLTVDIEGISQKYYLMNVVNVLDCLDYDKATVRRYEKKITSIKHYAFIENQLRYALIFRIKHYELSCCYVTEQFKDVIVENNLTGLSFDSLLWESE